jgi:small subunit ribosomal protein S6
MLKSIRHPNRVVAFRFLRANGDVRRQSRGKEVPTMRNYEVIIIVHPDLDETALKGVSDRVQSWIQDSGGSIEKVDQWGKRRLAYSIRKQREGQYVYFETQFAPTFSAELERNLRFLEPVMRFSIVSKQ